MRILIIEDEEALAQRLKSELEREGYAVDYILDGASGMRRVGLYHDDYDLVVLDILLPEKNGFDICRYIRSENIMLPILIMSQRTATKDKVVALDSGADDYLVKPFSSEEFSARIRALLRRPVASLNDTITIGTLIMKIAERKVYQADQQIDLTLKEFELLHYLIRHHDQVVDRETLYRHLWDFADNVMSNVIDSHIKNLRRKLDVYKNGTMIETVRGVGYCIKTASSPTAPQH